MRQCDVRGQFWCRKCGVKKHAVKFFANQATMPSRQRRPVAPVCIECNMKALKRQNNLKSRQALAAVETERRKKERARDWWQ